MNNKQEPTPLSLVVNGRCIRVNPDTHSNLLSFLRSEMQLTGSKQGCATGNCGACSVLIDGVAMQSCQVSLAAVEQSRIETIETIETIVQTSLGKQITATLTRYDAAQCGYCLPGIVVAAYSELLTADTPDPVHALGRNLCRCGTHSRILNALREVMAAQDSST